MFKPESINMDALAPDKQENESDIQDLIKERNYLQMLQTNGSNEKEDWDPKIHFIRLNEVLALIKSQDSDLGPLNETEEERLRFLNKKQISGTAVESSSIDDQDITKWTSNNAEEQEGLNRRAA